MCGSFLPCRDSKSRAARTNEWCHGDSEEISAMKRQMKATMVLAALAGTALSTTAAAAISFAPAVNYSMGTSGGPGPAAESMVAADVDNDGDMDVVSADWWGSGVPVLLNNGNGTFGAPIFNDLNEGSGVGSVSVGDFNGDGKIDVAATGGSTLYILRGQGNGQFNIVQTLPYTVGGQYQGYAIDVNKDGKLDIVAPIATGIQVYLNQGNQFVQGPLSSLAAIISATTAIDYDHDGKVDLAVTDGVIVMRGNGDGSFTQATTVLVGFIPEDVIAGDLNGDGYDDLLTADSFSFTMSVSMSNGAGGYNTATRYLGTAGPVSLRLADFDRDGDRDVIVSSMLIYSEQVYSNDGQGSLSLLPQYFMTTFQPQTPAIADYNRDGKLDVAVGGTSGQMSVLINTSP